MVLPVKLARGFKVMGFLKIPNHKSQANYNDQSASGGPNLFRSFGIGI
jgi:hypothetical protein